MSLVFQIGWINYCESFQNNKSSLICQQLMTYFVVDAQRK